MLIASLADPALSEQSVPSAEQLQRLEEKIGEISEWLKQAKDDRSELIQSLAALEHELGRINTRLHRLNQQQEELEDKLAALDEQARDLKDKLQSQRKSLALQLRNAWMQGSAPGLKVLLNEADPQRIARQMVYYDYLSQAAVGRLEQFRQTMEELQENRAQALAARDKLAQSQKQAETERQKQEARQTEREEMLVALKENISERQSELQHLQADRARLESLMEQVQEAVRSLELPEKSTPFHQLAEELPWPAPGKVVADYGEPMAGGKLRRNGLVIETTPGEPVIAVHYGRVVFADWLRGFGLMLIIDHGDGYMSLYGQNGALLKNVGEWVAAGEAVALAGTSGGTPPGLYFEIRKDGRPTRPGEWLRDR